MPSPSARFFFGRCAIPKHRRAGRPSDRPLESRRIDGPKNRRRANALERLDAPASMAAGRHGKQCRERGDERRYVVAAANIPAGRPSRLLARFSPRFSMIVCDGLATFSTRVAVPRRTPSSAHPILVDDNNRRGLDAATGAGAGARTFGVAAFGSFPDPPPAADPKTITISGMMVLPSARLLTDDRSRAENALDFGEHHL